MAYFPFEQDDVVKNTLIAHPRVEFYVYQNEVFYNNAQHLSGAFSSSVPNVPNGYLNLYEYNVDRTDQASARGGGTGLITPFVFKDGKETAFKTLTKKEFNELDEGSIIYGSYPLSASITKKYYVADSTDHQTTGSALTNTLNYYSYLSPHYSSSKAEPNVWNKADQDFGLIDIPSVFYGSSIKKGTVELNFYISGTLAAQVRDINKNGELIQVSGTANDLGSDFGSSSVAGVVLYNEGLIYLTGNWAINPDAAKQQRYIPGSATGDFPKWKYFAYGANDPDAVVSIPSSSYEIKFSGSTETQTVTMFANAPMGMLNYSNNPTFIQYSQSLDPIVGRTFYSEPPKTLIKNTVSGTFSDLTESFSKQTFISSVKIYDDDMNCIGIAKLATPVKKTEERDLTFKLKLDI